MSKLMRQAKVDLLALSKIANTATPQGSELKAWLRLLAPAMLTAGIGGIAGYKAGKNSESAIKEEADKLKASFHSTFDKSPSFKKDPSLYSQRFSELALISPTIAKNPNFAHKIIEGSLHTGFGVDDIHKLSAIEFQRSNTKQLSMPEQASAAARANAMSTVVNIFGVRMLDGVLEAGKDLNDIHAARVAKTVAENEARSAASKASGIHKVQDAPFNSKQKDILREAMDAETAKYMAEKKLRAAAATAPKEDKKPGGLFGWLKKESSMANVSDECLGQMLAERHQMLKTAGMWDSIKKNMGPGTEAMAGYLKFMAPSLLIGGGGALVQHVLQSQKDKKAANEAEQVYLNIAKSSDVMKQNPAAAREIFSTMQMFAPTLATRPMLVKTFVEHTLQNDHMAPQAIKELADAEASAGRKGGTTFLKSFKENVDLVGKPVADFGTQFDKAKKEHAKRSSTFAERDKK